MCIEVKWGTLEGRREMTGIRKVGNRIGLVFLVGILLFGGCALFGRGGGAKPSGVDEDKKRRLMRRRPGC